MVSYDAVQKWQAKNYETVLLRIRKGEKDKLKEAAQAAGLSVNRLIINAVNEQFPGLLSPLDDDSKKKKSGGD